MKFQCNGITIHCHQSGAGDPLLWVHGFFGAGADWRYVFAEPPGGFRVIAPDLRGHGASTNPTGRFSFREAARDVLALLDHLGIERVRAIGLSGGGLVLLHLATAAPRRLESMVLVSAPPYFPARAREVQRQMSTAMFAPGELELMRRRHAGGDKQIDDLVQQCRALADSYDDVAFTPPWLATIEAETLIVFGDRDPLYPVSLAFELYDAIPRAHLFIVPNGGHAPVFGAEAAGFAAVAMPFLRGEWRATAAVPSPAP